jgi:hypothetical protein
VEGLGYSPDIDVKWTIEDYISGIDPEILAVMDCIEIQQKSRSILYHFK